MGFLFTFSILSYDILVLKMVTLSCEYLQTSSDLIEGRCQLMFMTRPGTASPIQVTIELSVLCPSANNSLTLNIFVQSYVSMSRNKSLLCQTNELYNSYELARSLVGKCLNRALLHTLFKQHSRLLTKGRNGL